MVITGLLFVGVTGFVRYLGTSVPSAQAAFLRYLIGTVMLLPFLPRALADGLPDLRLFALRGVAHSFGVALWFFAMARIPIADVTAMNYLAPIYVTIGAALFLGEKLAFRRVAAVIVALMGAVVILRPGFREISAGHYAMLLATIVFGASYLLAKHLADRSNPLFLVMALSIAVTIGLAPMAAAVWVTPSWGELAILSVVALLATAGHFTMSVAFKYGPVSVTQPVTFLQLFWAVLLGNLVFGEPLDPWVILGGGMILGAVSFMTWREAVLRRRVVTPHSLAPKAQ